ncbi:hypothetical protein DVH24_029961 [Malus domestica]|uniref:Uncharacterized protein n=1 Tax=Malus domestica TaxID=3750 RepID=A0A498HWQ7_MALDO|nr:hypothetical protein DVH24_029961 [Malus domestica]
MSKRSTNASTNDGIKQKQNNSDTQYNLLVKYVISKIVKVLFRLKLIHFFIELHGLNISAVLADQLLCNMLSKMSIMIKHITLHILKKMVHGSDQKRKQVVIEKIFDDENHNLINKGQAFFQKNRIDYPAILFFPVVSASLQAIYTEADKYL